MDRLLGKTVAGKYLLKRLLGEGGMGRVFLGVERATQRTVAIKLLHESLSEDPRFVQRMEREALAVSRVSHPNAPALYEFGQDPLGVYLVMEYLEGDSLWTRLGEGGRLEPEEAVSYLLQVLETLSLCHAAGVVHRDLKPDNIMLCPLGKTRVAKLLDFGIARLSEGPAVTRTGQILGTPAYMSPEQILGKGIGPASDLYSLGIILYELLTGRLPFEEPSQLELFRKHLMVPPPSLAHAGPLAPTLQPFEAVLARALQKSPRDRFPSADAFASALRRALASSRDLSPDGGAPLLAEATLPSLVAPPPLALDETAEDEESREGVTLLDEEVDPETLWGDARLDETLGATAETLLSLPALSPSRLPAPGGAPLAEVSHAPKLPVLPEDLLPVCRVSATEKMLPVPPPAAPTPVLLRPASLPLWQRVRQLCRELMRRLWRPSPLSSPS